MHTQVQYEYFANKSEKYFKLKNKMEKKKTVCIYKKNAFTFIIYDDEDDEQPTNNSCHHK